MSNFLAAVIDSAHVASSHWQTLAVLLLVVVASQLLLYLALKGIFRDLFLGAEYFSLSLAGWLLPASLVSLLWYGSGILLSPQTGFLVSIAFAFVVGLVLYAQTHRQPIRLFRPAILLLSALAALFMLLRLAFVAKAVFPLYFDSAEHYRFTKEILATLDPSNGIAWTLTTYYHLGFHFLAAFLTFITQAQINEIMLLLGQVILALMPFGAFFLVRHGTRSNTAGMFALLLAALGWYMPAHALDWGKYPALTGIALMPFVFSMGYLLVENIHARDSRRAWSLSAILVLAAAICIFLHSRSVVVFAIVALAWGITYFWRKLPGVLRFLILAAVTIVLTYEIVSIQTKGILGPLFDPYGFKAAVVTGVVLVLSLFAYRSYPAIVFSSVVIMLLLLLSIFIPLRNFFLGSANITLLDRPFVEIILYLPLTFLGGFGLAGLEQFLQEKKFVWSRTVSYLLLLTVIVHAFLKIDLYPSDCCAIISNEDLEAIGWMNNALPKDARILVSSTELNVLPTDAFQGNAGGDAGTWIAPLINRPTILMPSNTDFHQPQTLETICRWQAEYVYVGELGAKFDDSGMSAQPDKYMLLFYVPEVKIYQVTGCR